MPIPPTLVTILAQTQAIAPLSNASFPAIGRAIALESISGATSTAHAASSALLETTESALGITNGASLRTALGEDLRQAALEQIRTHAEALRQSAEIIQRRHDRSRDQQAESSETQQRAKQGFLTPRPLFSY